MPSSDIFKRLLPSNEKGLVTTPTVKMPSSLATSATTGPAPVPVPPPMPAVIKTMCAPFNAARISSRASSAHARPWSGLAPAPRPVRPKRIWTGALVAAKACASVLQQIKSTPCTPDLIMCETALPPAPPTPTTLMTVPLLALSNISNIIIDSLKS